uniref:Uncharacterized protein n=1 Tax=Tanacetum cinerariifolium TaxID=118510 RepID=A0A699GT23_TANCI|nr:hypothetical protein [Tanacetum cinerariifolium]
MKEASASVVFNQSVSFAVYKLNRAVISILKFLKRKLDLHKMAQNADVITCKAAVVRVLGGPVMVEERFAPPKVSEVKINMIMARLWSKILEGAYCELIRLQELCEYSEKQEGVLLLFRLKLIFAYLLMGV